MFITNFCLDSHSQVFCLIILAITVLAFSLSLFLSIKSQMVETIIIPCLFLILVLMALFPSLKPNEYKLTIAYVNVSENNKTMTKDVAINTLLNDRIYPKYNLKYKTEKETFKLTKEEYEKLSKIYYDDLNNRR